MQFDFIQFLKQLPFSRLILSLIIGILIGLNIPVGIHFFTVFFVLTLVTAFLSRKIIFKKKNFKNRWIPGFILNISFLLGGILLLNVNSPEKFKYYNTEITGEAVISEPITEKTNSYKTVLSSVIFKYQDSIIHKKSKIIAYFPKTEKPKNLKYGDKLFFSGKISEIKNPGNPHEFDYKKYLYRKGITGQIFLNSNKFIVTGYNAGNPIFAFAYQTRNRLENIYENYGIKGNELHVLQALTLGDRSEINDKIKQSYVVSGAMHILAVSGLHVGIIFVLFNFLLKFLDKIKYKEKQIGKFIKAVFLILIIWSFAILSGLSPSVRRAAIMFSFVIAGKALNRYVNIYNSISASAFILLIINPYLITEVGFQLSYAAVLGIIFFQPKIVAIFTVKNKILYYLWSLTAVSIAAQIGTFPISLYYFHLFPTLFFLSNIIVIPAATLILISAFFLLISSGLPYIPDFIAAFLKYILKFLNTSVSFIEKIPYSSIQNISFHTEDLIFAFLFIIFSTIFILLKKLKALQISLILLIIWISFGTLRKIQNSRKSQLIVYNVNKFTAVDITGTQNYFLSEKSILKTKNIIYNIIPNRQHLNKSDFQFIPVDTINFNSKIIKKKGAFIAAGNKTVLLLSGKNQTLPEIKPKPKVDYVILSGKSNIRIKEITNKIDFEQIIFDSSNNYYILKKRKNECRDLNLNYFSVKDSGAFSLFF